MAKTISLVDKLSVRLQKLGVTKRKAATLATGLRATASKTPVKGTVTEKLEARLVKLGVAKRKAHELAVKLAPTVKAALKAKAKTTAVKLADVDDTFVNDAVEDVVDTADDPELDKVAPKVNGHRLRLDLPVVQRSEWQRHPVKGLELLRVVDGLTSTATYLTAAVKGESAMVAVRELGRDEYNVKFYPTLAVWNLSQEDLRALGGYAFLQREWYERMHFSAAGVEQVLGRLNGQAKSKSRIKHLADRLLALTAGPLFKAFGYLHKRERIVA